MLLLFCKLLISLIMRGQKFGGTFAGPLFYTDKKGKDCTFRSTSPSQQQKRSWGCAVRTWLPWCQSRQQWNESPFWSRHTTSLHCRTVTQMAGRETHWQRNNKILSGRPNFQFPRDNWCLGSLTIALKFMVGELTVQFLFHHYDETVTV